MRKNLVIAIILFTSLFLISVVYAAVSGNLDYSGYVARSVNVDLRIVNTTLQNPRLGETVTVSSALNDYKTLQINLSLLQPGDERKITFQLQNVGNVATTLASLVTVNPDYYASCIMVNWPELSGLVIHPGTTSAVYEIKVTWDVNQLRTISGLYSFTATVNYAQ